MFDSSKANRFESQALGSFLEYSDMHHRNDKKKESHFCSYINNKRMYFIGVCIVVFFVGFLVLISYFITGNMPTSSIASPSKGQTLQEDLPISGIYNIGNTCYINALLAALRSTQSIFDLLVSYLSKKHNSTDKEHEACRLTANMLQSTLSPKPVPRQEVEGVIRLFQAISPNIFAPGMQGDAQEALLALIDIFAKCIPDFETKSNIRGYTDNQFECQDRHTTKMKTWFTTYSLSISEPTKKQKLEDLMLYNIHDQVLDHNCSSCNSTRSTCRTVYMNYPNTLIIHLERFTNDHLKVSCAIELAAVLKLNSKLYHLKAIISHLGSSAHVGHYVCDFIHNDVWYTQDDAIITLHPSVESILQIRIETAYLVFYEMSK